ncbi:MAG: hypothetical protein AUK47_22855 [Deltaproteobacteria bacterium CG2_30_63_29]|nr:MAG: hypothetical protein AUK47_22855 [Deltaproteobacteria bacterium CG2_30_63_29]PIW00009.1 MAG: hypothetical protein COW42_09205 [Deltaproteobacteria bacterium CG17_big_fil_post_rev_8_21_14_2_50_63_7]
MVTTCNNHTALSAAWTCNDCFADFCDSCVVKKDMTYATFELCPTCGGACHPRRYGGMAARDFDFVGSVPKALTYPATPSIFMVLGIMVFVLFFVYLMAATFIFVVFGLLVKLVIYGYFGVYAMSIARTTGLGEDEPPDWPDGSDLRADLGSAILRFFGAMLVPYFPAILLFLGILFGYLSTSVTPFIFIFAIIGSLYAPMSLLAVSMGQTIGAASPHVCFPAIRVCLKDYALAIVFLLGVVLLNWLVSVTITLQIGFIGLLIAESIGFYFMMVQARVMGLLYRAHHEEFNWVV